MQSAVEAGRMPGFGLVDAVTTSTLWKGAQEDGLLLPGGCWAQSGLCRVKPLISNVLLAPRWGGELGSPGSIPVSLQAAVSKV